MASYSISFQTLTENWSSLHAKILQKTEQQEIHTKEILTIRDKSNTVMAKHTGRDLEDVAKDTDRDNFMDGKAAVDYGLIDNVMEKRPV